jgi:hypothetical protein
MESDDVSKEDDFSELYGRDSDQTAVGAINIERGLEASKVAVRGQSRSPGNRGNTNDTQLRLKYSIFR